MTLREVALSVLRLSGITSLDSSIEENSLNKRGISEGDLTEVRHCLNAAAQEACAKGPVSLTEQEITEVLRPATEISMTVTQDSKTVSVISGWQSWMKGCTVRIGSDSFDNRLLSQTSIKAPFNGDSGSVTAWVYGDAIALPQRFLHVLEPIQLGNRRLELTDDLSQFRNIQRFASQTTYETQNSFAQMATGTPVVAMVQTQYEDGLGYTPNYLRVNPLPSERCRISFRVKLKPITFTDAQIDNGDEETDPGTLIAQDWNESILLPIAKKRWTADHSVSLEAYQLAEINRQYEVALELLQAQRPKPGSVEARYI